jgi:1,4-dihydroxy-6-naphthoate synthase
MTSATGLTRTLSVAHSPDSDDAFMFFALAEGLVSTPIRYRHELCDIETLNQRALRGELEVSAVSIHAYAYLAERYALLPSGASMGDGYGPRLVGLRPPPGEVRAAIRGARVAVPGRLTTAALALGLFQPDHQAVLVPFDRVQHAVRDGAADLALVIHEGQLTYRDEGFHLWADLGAWWKDETGLPLPLGGNVVRRDLGPEVMAQVARDVRASVEYALAHREAALSHAARFSRGLDPERTDTFVEMYVNQWTVEYGPLGRLAVQTLLDRAACADLVPAVRVDFVECTA